MRMLSKSVLLVLLLLSFAALASHAPIAQNQSQAESASFKNVEETVSRLLLVPVYTASDEKLLNDAGDEAARAITRVVSEQEMNSPETGRRILLILHLAFEAPQSIIGQNNKTATVATRLLDQLEHTDYGHQPNVIGNARFEIKHNGIVSHSRQQTRFLLLSLSPQKRHDPCPAISVFPGRFFVCS